MVFVLIYIYILSVIPWQCLTHVLRTTCNSQLSTQLPGWLIWGDVQYLSLRFNGNKGIALFRLDRSAIVSPLHVSHEILSSEKASEGAKKSKPPCAGRGEPYSTKCCGSGAQARRRSSRQINHTNSIMWCGLFTRPFRRSEDPRQKSGLPKYFRLSRVLWTSP